MLMSLMDNNRSGTASFDEFTHGLQVIKTINTKYRGSVNVLYMKTEG
jgi:hypothetical protein